MNTWPKAIGTIFLIVAAIGMVIGVLEKDTAERALAIAFAVASYTVYLNITKKDRDD